MVQTTKQLARKTSRHFPVAKADRLCSRPSPRDLRADAHSTGAHAVLLEQQTEFACRTNELG
jgi:hypothetical protein